MYFYKTIKLSNECEHYLTSVNVATFRICLTQFRTSCSDLMVSQGRRLGIPKSERFCPLCIIPIVETEYHVCLVCPFYKDLRRNFIPRFYYTFPSEYKCELLFTSTNDVLINNLARFVFFALKLRNKQLSIHWIIFFCIKYTCYTIYSLTILLHVNAFVALYC